MQVSTVRNIAILGASAGLGGLAVSALGLGGAAASRLQDDHPVAAGAAFAGGVAGLAGGMLLSQRVLRAATPMLDAGIGARTLGTAVVLGSVALGLAPGAVAAST